MRDEDKKEVNDPNLFISKFEGKEYYALRTHLGLVSDHAKELIKEKNFPEWLIKYPSMFPDAKKEYNPEEYLIDLNDEEVRLLSEFLGLKPYKPNGFTSQILISAKNKETNEIEEYSVSRLNTNKDTVNARLISNPQGGIVKIPTEDIIVNKKLRPSWINYSDPLTNNVRGMNFDAIKCLNNSVFVTIIATIITVLINSMAAFAFALLRASPCNLSSLSRLRFSSASRLLDSTSSVSTLMEVMSCMPVCFRRSRCNTLSAICCAPVRFRSFSSVSFCTTIS